VAVDPGTGQISLRAEFPNPDHLLLPGMFVRVSINQGVDENALLIPEQAVQYSSSGAASVMVVNEEGVVAAVPVRVGANYGERIMITEGLKQGDQVVVEGFQKIGPGATVKPMPWQGNSGAEDASSNQSDAPAAQDQEVEAAEPAPETSNAPASE